MVVFLLRYVADVIPNKVASLTLIHSPAKGSPVANLVNNVLFQQEQHKAFW
jgi:triacylglycerol lipase